MMESEAFRSAFIAIGSGWGVHDEILPEVEKFVYGQKYSDGVNAARYNLFRLTCRSEATPPNQDCLKHHIARKNDQIAPLTFIDTPSAICHGWQAEDGQLVYKWMAKSPAPHYVLNSIKCMQSGYKCTCSCLKGRLPCRDYCQCVSELISHLMEWLTVEVAMTQTSMIPNNQGQVYNS